MSRCLSVTGITFIEKGYYMLCYHDVCDGDYGMDVIIVGPYFYYPVAICAIFFIFLVFHEDLY